MPLVSRRAFVMGAALVGCTGATRGLPGFASAADAKDHWTARFLGRPPTSMLSLRFVAPKPRELVPLFTRWRAPGLQTDPPSFEQQVMPFGYTALKQCPDAELFAVADGPTIAVLRGVPRGADPFVVRCFQKDGDLCGYRLADFKLVGIAPSGVLQARTGRDALLFRLPDGTTWVAAEGLAAMRLADALAKDPSVPPSERFEPTAPVAQLHLTTGGASPLGGSLLGADQLFAWSSIAYPASNGAPVPVAWKLHFRTTDAARAATADLGRIFARARAEKEHRSDRFPVAGTLTADGATLLVRGTMPFDELARWTG